MLTDLRLVDFRCFERLRFEPGPGTNFIIGANAQGKTSILEAVCVIARLQSPRTTTLAEIVRIGCAGAAIDARISDAHLHFRYEPPKRTLALDSVAQKSAIHYLRIAHVAWFSNDDLEIVRGSSSRRRRYFDFLCSQLDPVYLRHLRAYDRALRSRNALLKDARPRREIEAFDPLLAEHGDLLSTARSEAARDLAPLIAQAVQDIGGREESIVTRHHPGAKGPLLEELSATRNEEIRLCQTIVGPHRDDLAIELNGMEVARFASEGQQRTVALALKLAQTRLIMARTGRSPLLLIDDVFGELDPARRQNLLSHLPADAQRLVTATHLDWLATSLQGTVFQLKNHALSAATIPSTS